MYKNNAQNLEYKNIHNITLILRTYEYELHTNERYGQWEKTSQLMVYGEKPTMRENALTRRGAKNTRLFLTPSSSILIIIFLPHTVNGLNKDH